MLLLADKDPYDLEALRSELVSPDVQIITATDGAEALRLIHEHSPGVIVVASSLGQMGGFAISRELKMRADGEDGRPAPKIIVLIEREQDAWLADWSRCDAHLTKPVDLDELRALIGVSAA